MILNAEKKGTILALITAIVSGLAIPVNKIFVVNIDPTVFTALRSLMIGTVFLILSLRKMDFDFKRFTNSKWNHLLFIAVIGGSLAFLLFFNGLKLTTSGRAAFLHKTLPIYVTLLAFIFLKEKVEKKQLIWLGVMLFGTFLIYIDSINPTELWSNPQLGDLLIIGATFLWAVENVLSRKVMIKGEDNFLVSFSRMFFGGLILFGFILLTGKFYILATLTFNQIVSIGISTLMLFCYVFFWYWSIKLINVSKASTILLLSPVISMVAGVLIFSEPVPIVQLIGSALILAGAYTVSRIKSEILRV